MVRAQFSEAAIEAASEVAIVGAGVSGLYAAWRLVETDPNVTVTIVERLDRTGGRLDSDIIEIAPGERVREEEGGMRFNYGMTELMNLNKALGLCDQIVVFPMGSDDKPNRMSIRGRTFTLSDVAESGNALWSELYDLKPEEQGLSPTDLVTAAYRNVLLANGWEYRSGQTPDEWTEFRTTCTWNGRPMNEWQLWGLLRTMGYSEDCIQMLSETIGFAGPFRSLANAGDAFQILADFPTDPEYFTFELGFSTLPNALVERLERDHGDRVTILLSTNVSQIDRADAGFTLTLRQAIRPVNARRTQRAASPKYLSTGQIVLAAAAKGCQDLFVDSPALRDAPDGERLWDALYAALGMKLMKINLYFTKPWWHNGVSARPPVQFGPNFSDQPINAVYPFYALPESGSEPDDDVPPIRDAAAALTIYCDFDNTNFWHGLQNLEPMFDSELQRRENAREPRVVYPASRHVVDEAKRQLALLFGINQVPEPVLTSYRLWDGEEDFEFAYHQWRLNTNDHEVRRYLANPMEGVYVCNEAFSDMHGWVNGSLRSTDDALALIGHAMFDKPIKPLPDDPCAHPDQRPTGVEKPMGLWGG